MKFKCTAKIVVGLMLITAVALLLERNAILGYMLKYAVETKSEGKIEFESGEIHWDFKTWEITVKNPVLKLHRFFLSENDSLKVNNISFDKLIINGLSFRRLFVDKDLVCSKIILDKPYLKLSQNGNISSRNHKKTPFDPFVLVKILKSRSLGKTDIFLDINTTVVNFGKVNILESNAENGKGAAVYSVNISGLKTTKRNGTNELVYNELKAGVGKLKYFFPEKKYYLLLDTLIYRSKKKVLAVNGLNLYRQKADTSIGISDFYAGTVKLQGVVLDNADSLLSKQIFLKKFELENGKIKYKTSGGRTKGMYNDKTVLTLLFRYFTKIQFDTVSFNGVDFLLANIFNDTIAYAQNITAVATKFRFDSTVLEKGLKGFAFNDFRFSFKEFSYAKASFNIKTKSVLFSEKEKKLQLGKTNLSLSGIAGKAKSVFMNKFTLKNLINKRRQNIRLTIESPFFTLETKSDSTMPQFIKRDAAKKINRLFSFENIVINNGFFNYHKDEKIGISAEKFYCRLKGFSVDSILKNKKTLFYKDFVFNAKTLNFHDKDKKLDASINDFHIDGTGFSTGAIFLKSFTENIIRETTASGLSASVLNLNRLIFNNNLKLKKLKILEPSIKLTRLNRDNLQVENGSYGYFDYFIDKISAENGRIFYTRFYNSDTLLISSDFNIYVSDFTNDNSIAGNNTKLIYLNKLNINKGKSELRAEKAAVNENDGSVNVNNLTLLINKIKYKIDTKIDKAKIKGVNFELLKKDTLSFKTLKLTGDTLAFTLRKEFDAAIKNQVDVPLVFDSVFVAYDVVKYNNKVSAEKSSTLRAEGLSFGFFYGDGFNVLINDTTVNILKSMDFGLRKLSLEIPREKIKMTFSGIGIEDETVSIKSVSAFKTVKFGKELFDNEIRAMNIRLDTARYNLALSKLTIKALSSKTLNLNVNADSLDITEKINRKSENFGKKKKIDFLFIDTAYCNNFNFKFKSAGGAITNAEGLNVSINKIDVKPVSTFVTRPYIFKELMIDMRNKTVYSNDSLYEIKLKSFDLNLPLHRLRLDTLTVMPLLDDSLFFEKAGYQTDRIKLFADKTLINNIDLDTLVKTGFLKVENIFASGINLDVMRDKRYPLNPDIKRKMPLQLLNSIPVKYRIDSINTYNALITYSEIAVKSNLPGRVFFTDVNARVKNITNSKDFANDLSTLNMMFSGKISADAPFNINITVPYKNNIYNNFWFSANSGIIHFKNLNPMTKNLLGIYFKSGKGSVSIPFASGNDTVIKGKMIFKYKRLKFGLYNREKAEEYKGIASPFINFVLNNVMIRSNNPRFFGKTKAGIIYYERNPSKSFVNYVWKGILSGSLSTMGFNTKQQRHEKKEYKKLEKSKVRQHN